MPTDLIIWAFHAAKQAKLAKLRRDLLDPAGTGGGGGGGKGEGVYGRCYAHLHAISCRHCKGQNICNFL